MSSDYGSDISPDDVPAIESLQPAAMAMAPATPCKPLVERGANVLTTPPSLQMQKRKACDTPPESQPESQRKKRRYLPFNTPAAPVASLNRTSTMTSSQALPTPTTCTKIPTSPSRPPPSSQPTPTKRAHAAHMSTTPATMCTPYASYRASYPSPAVRAGQPVEAPLYRFPFGAHSGKTLLEVPENYIAYLRVDHAMADSMPGFAGALCLFDAGQPPVAPLPAPLPNRPEHSTPPSSAPARFSSSQQAENCDIISKDALDASSSSLYRFDFGIHTGKTLAEVPPEYVAFLKQRGIVEGKPALAVAVIRFERENAPSATAASKSRSDPAQYTLKFGKHIGKTVSEVPEQYLTWLKTTKILHENEDLRNAVAHHERTRTPAKSKSAKRRRTPNILMPSGKSLDWNHRRLDGCPRYRGRRGW
ncbi:hypothetical protein EKO04_004320 [Ascochyta lentis]|uniref:Uncharacterized protein n=1 Tax=Ascochyta lentis TaxID=205686 RepID=A0A8H7MIT3_9PLEO|nr:hypothetical protein EKO04_004320 [Ascochyta lentis]